MPSPAASPSPRDRLLEALVDHLAEHGAHDVTLRGLAAAVGTSHRMLAYHFGSRDGALVAVARAVEERQRAALADLTLAAAPLEVMERMWERLAEPALWPVERLFFDLHARALHGDPRVEPLLDGIVEDWVGPQQALFEALGFTPAGARTEARLALAVARGLLLDLLATGDRAATDAAFHAYLARYAA